MGSGSPEGELVAFLCDAFDTDELRRSLQLFAWANDCDELVQTLPAPSASPAELAHAVVVGLRRRSLLGERFFEHLCESRTSRRSEVSALAAAVAGVRPAAASPAVRAPTKGAVKLVLGTPRRLLGLFRMGFAARMGLLERASFGVGKGIVAVAQLSEPMTLCAFHATFTADGVELVRVFPDADYAGPSGRRGSLVSQVTIADGRVTEPPGPKAFVLFACASDGPLARLLDVPLDLPAVFDDFEAFLRDATPEHGVALVARYEARA